MTLVVGLVGCSTMEGDYPCVLPELPMVAQADDFPDVATANLELFLADDSAYGTPSTPPPTSLYVVLRFDNGVAWSFGLTPDETQRLIDGEEVAAPRQSVRPDPPRLLFPLSTHSAGPARYFEALSLRLDSATGEVTTLLSLGEAVLSPTFPMPTDTTRPATAEVRIHGLPLLSCSADGEWDARLRTEFCRATVAEFGLSPLVEMGAHEVPPVDLCAGP